MLKTLYRLLGVMVIITTLVVAAGLIEYHYFANTPLNLGEKGLHYEVRSGLGLQEIARDLERRGIIGHWIYLTALGQWQGKAHRIKAGEYEFAPGLTPTQLLDQMTAGQVLEHSLTVVEGWTFKQLLEAVAKDEMLSHTLMMVNDGQIMAKVGWPGEHPEGRFYPDTYYFPKGTTDVAFLQRAHLAMSKRLEAEWRNRSAGLPLNTPYEALILASIVEKETALPSERKPIAGVFIRRLQKGMRLQTDPTIIYGLGVSYNGNITRRDLSRDTAYNTYLHPGLPPTPIALPSAESIHAVLHPELGSSLYFVSRGDGSHEFSETIEQHNNAVQNYQVKGHKDLGG